MHVRFHPRSAITNHKTKTMIIVHFVGNNRNFISIPSILIKIYKVVGIDRLQM